MVSHRPWYTKTVRSQNGSKTTAQPENVILTPVTITEVTSVSRHVDGHVTLRTEVLDGGSLLLQNRKSFESNPRPKKDSLLTENLTQMVQ
jgi:hypothetical protein